MNTATGTPILKLEDVRVDLGNECILERISLQVYPGETLVLVGPSGGGKTVLLKTMMGLYAPTRGRVVFRGEDWQTLDPQRKRELSEKVGVQFQKTALFDDLTSAENVAFPIREHHPLREEKIVQERVQFCLDSVNLAAAYSQFPHELSGGMRQRLAVARALALNPEMLFYDDPTAGLDPINSDRMMDLLLNLQKKFHSTLIVVTHDILRAYQLAGRILLVANKEVLETGSAEATKKHSDPRVQQFIKGHLSGPLVWG